MEASPPIRVNRAPVLTLWATVVAERLGYPTDTALTLGRDVSVLPAKDGTLRGDDNGKPASALISTLRIFGGWTIMSWPRRCLRGR